MKEEKSFEELFPSLKNKMLYTLWEYDEPQPGSMWIDTLPKDRIVEYCIDKERVKEVIGEITLIRGITHENQISNAVNNERMRILKELELEE